MLEPPVALAPIEIRQVWHRRTEADAAVRFLRALVLDAARLGAPEEARRRRTRRSVSERGSHRRGS